jgi:hypothetical protein
MSGSFFTVMKFVFTALAIGYGIYVYPLVVKKNWAIKLIALMALCYPLGKAIEFWIIGPEIVRGHLSDFGFVPCLALFLYETEWMKRFDPWRRWLVGATAVLALAASVEAVELALQHLEVAKHAPTRGDWGDMASYFISYFLLLILARIQVVKLRAATSAHTAVVEEGRRAEVQARRESRRQQTPNGKPRRRPHGRRRSSHGTRR